MAKEANNTPKETKAIFDKMVKAMVTPKPSEKNKTAKIMKYKVTYQYRYKEPSDTTKVMTEVITITSEKEIGQTEAMREFYKKYDQSGHHIIDQKIEKIG